MKLITDLSPNFSKNNRSKLKIKFVIIHYTGMQSEIESLKRLKNSRSKVSCHYLINRNGIIVNMVPDNKIAWHAGKSKWRNFINLNESSIGIELVNRGHKLGYENYTNIQLKNLIKLCKNLKSKYRINSKNFLGHSDIAPLRKIDPGEKFPWKKLSKFNLGVWYKNKKTKINFKNKKKLRNLFFKNIYKIGYRYFNLKKSGKKDYLVIQAFQRRFNPKHVKGRLDQKTLEISDFLANSDKLA